MSACGSLQHMFENPFPSESPTLLESLSLSQIKTVKSIDHSSSCTEIFGELHFKESSSPSPSPSSLSLSPSPSLSLSPSPSLSSSFIEIFNTKLLGQKHGVSMSCDNYQTPSSPYVSSTPIATNHTNSHQSSESLQLCTEGLGLESSGDVDDVEDLMKIDVNNEGSKKDVPLSNDSNGECKSNRLKVKGGEYPPPISSIGRTGKPWVSFKSYRKNGRFVLKEIRIPTQEFLHAYREDGRLKLQFVQSDDELLDEEDYDIDDYEDEDDWDDVESMEGEEDMAKENDESIKDKGNEDKEVDV